MKKLFIAVAALGALAVLGYATLYANYRYQEHQALYGKVRKEWKNAAIGTVANLANDPRWLTNEISAIEAAPHVPEGGGIPEWVSQNLILTSSGQWIVYTNVCCKENARIRDLFIGRGSDGKWYHSDFHFCVKMVTFTVWPFPEPNNIQQFAQWCSLAEFDGHSDDCLKPTWDRKVPKVIRDQNGHIRDGNDRPR
jgi:hypothetical protein